MRSQPKEEWEKETFQAEVPLMRALEWEELGVFEKLIYSLWGRNTEADTRMAETRGEREVSNYTITGPSCGSLDFILSSEFSTDFCFPKITLYENGQTVMKVRWC